MNDDGEIVSYVEIKTNITKEKELGVLLIEQRKELEAELKNKVKDVIKAQRASIISMAKLTEARDYDTGKHIERVQYLSRTLAKQLARDSSYKDQVDIQFINDIFYSSALHDIGKIKISDNILLKPGSLTDEKFDEMKKHVDYGEEVLMDLVKNYPKSSIFTQAIKVVKYHHEKFDGRGYSNGLKGTEIPLEGRIMALVDAYDAIRSRRTYKSGFNHQTTYNIITGDSGTHFDPEIVKAFIAVNEEFNNIYNALA